MQLCPKLAQCQYSDKERPTRRNSLLRPSGEELHSCQAVTNSGTRSTFPIDMNSVRSEDWGSLVFSHEGSWVLLF
jgi:hypothetical protein